MGSVDYSRRSLIAPKSSILPRASASGTTRRSENRIIINVGGIRYETYRSTLKNIPDTRLAWLANCKGQNPDFDPDSGEYFFDRHPGVFNMILNYYRTGKLHAPIDVCGPLFEEELAFWGLDEKQIEPCCWSNYRAHRDAQETLAEMDGGDAHSSESDTESSHLEDIREKFGIIEEANTDHRSRWHRVKPRVWKLLDDPTSSSLAKAFAFTSLAVLIVSIISFCMESHILFRESIRDPNTSLGPLTVREKEIHTKPMLFLEIVEYLIVTFFTLETVLRIIFCPSKTKFFQRVFNWVDICIVIPCYLCFIMLLVDSDIRSSIAFRVINAFRLIRIFRILKLTVHVSGLKILGHTIRASAKELLLLFLVLIIGVLIFACLIYYAEQVEEPDINSFPNIPRGFWWAVVTMTTLGYGDLYPRTALGYIIGTVCAVCGLLMLSLPVPVIVSNFTLYYTHAQARMKLPKKSRKQVLLHAASVLVDPDVTDKADTISEDSGSANHVTGSSIHRTSSEDSAFGSYPEKGKRNGDYIFGDKNGQTGISVIFTDHTPEPSPPLARRHTGDVTVSSFHVNDVTERGCLSQPTSASTLSPHRDSMDQTPQRLQRRLSFSIGPDVTPSRRTSTQNFRK